MKNMFESKEHIKYEPMEKNTKQQLNGLIILTKKTVLSHHLI